MPRRPIVRGVGSLLAASPALLGTLHGFKVEALAARERGDGSVELWVGVDDEHCGGTIRPLPAGW